MAKGFSSGLKAGFSVGSEIGGEIKARRTKKQFSELLRSAPEDLSPIEKISYAVQAGLEQGLFSPEEATPLIKSALETEQKRMEVERQKQLGQVMKQTRERAKAYAEAVKKGDFEAAMQVAQPLVGVYNSQLVPDGRTAELVRGENGLPVAVIKDAQSGQVLGRIPVTPEFFATQAQRLTAVQLAAVDPQLAVEFSRKPLFMSKKEATEILRSEAAAAKDRAAARRTAALTPLEAENLRASAERTRASTEEIRGLLPYRQMGLAAEAGLTSARRREIDALLPYRQRLMGAQVENFYSLSDLRKAQAEETRGLLPFRKDLLGSQAGLNQARTREIQELLPARKDFLGSQTAVNKAKVQGAPADPLEEVLRFADLWQKAGGQFATPEDLMGFQKFRSMMYSLSGRTEDDLSAVRRGLTMPRDTQSSPRASLPPGSTVLNPYGGRVLPPLTIDEAQRRLEEQRGGPLRMIIGGAY